MKFRILEISVQTYLIDIGNCINECLIAKKILNISYDKYIEILIRNNAFYCGNLIWNYSYFFKIKEDAENVIKELEPYLIMAKLTE